MPTLPDDNADYTLQVKTKAVVFTHLKVNPEDISRAAPQDSVEKYVPFFKGYLKCQNVGLVYLYFSSGVERVIRNVAEGRDLVVPPKVLDDEAICLDILQLAETQVREVYPSKSLRFIYVATFQLASLLRNLFEIDHGLLGFLHGHGVFTYDSPKFVEAVIRLARAQRPQLAFYPVVRFDEDVEVCERSLSILLAEYERLLLQSPNLYFFFSGSYSDPDQPDDFDYINDRAVRTHWFSHRDGGGYIPDPEKIKLFWRVLGEIGATQLGRDDDPSRAGVGLTIERNLSANRGACQVISGAGLIMSIKAIQDLPPFMNVNRLIVWIDDHLKRQLHEAVGHINSREMESVTEARFKQNRHPNGISQQDIDWAVEKYFDALLAGCMMDSIISQPCKQDNNVIREPTEFARAVEDIITKLIGGEGENYQSIKPQLIEYAERRYDQVLSLWQTPEFQDTVLCNWAKTRDATHKTKQVTEVVDDALAYLELVKRWRGPFAAAIGQLRPIGNHWLFELVPA